MKDICKQKMILISLLDCTAVFVQRDNSNCNYLFNCGLHFKNVVLRKIFGGKMEK